MPNILAIVDLFTMLVCAIYIIARVPTIAKVSSRRFVSFSLLGYVVVIAWGVVVTYFHDGANLLEGAKYNVALLRIAFLLLSVFVFIESNTPGSIAGKRSSVLLDFKIILVSQVLFGALQYALPAMSDVLVVTLSEATSAQYAVLEGDVSGTLPNSVDLAFLMLAIYLGFSLDQGLARNRMFTGFIFLLIFFTGSLASSFLAIFAFLYFRTVSNDAKYWRIAAVQFLLLAVAVFSIYSKFSLDVLNSKLDNMMLSRLGLISQSLPLMILEDLRSIVFGLGADFVYVRDFLLGLPAYPLVLTYPGSEVVINDVFWFALIVAVGAPVAGIYIWMLFSCIRKLTNGDLHFFRFSVIMILLSGFVTQIALLRSFGVAFALVFFIVSLKGTGENTEYRFASRLNKYADRVSF